VTFTGGEPLKHPDVLEIVAEARTRAFVVKLYTNGSLVDEATALRLSELRVFSVEMSLHGSTAEIHDSATLRPGSFEEMWNGIRNLRIAGLRVLLKTPLTSSNEDDWERMASLAEREGIPYRIDLSLAARDNGDLSPLRLRPGAGATERVMRRLRDEGMLSKVTRTRGEPACGLGRSTLAIDPEGNVYPCLQWRATSLGNVRETPVDVLWRASTVREDAMEIAIRANDRLLDAGPVFAASPFCPARAMLAGGDPLGFDPGFCERVDLADRIWSDGAGNV
jgi:MoaA/NifB/PqqE/SkfB family radical SAM enzyme